MYVDESGDSGRYRFKNGQNNTGSSKYFTLAGIIVSDAENERLGKAVNMLIDRYFDHIQLPEKFKMHYYPLIHNHYPYDQLSEIQRKQLADGMFDIIKKSDLYLLSITVNLEEHYEKHESVEPVALALLLLRDRFQNFLKEQNKNGFIVYELLSKRQKRKIEHHMKKLSKNMMFQDHVKFQNIRHHIRKGNPVKHPVLQLADFFAYSVWRRSTSHHAADRWESIKIKYYRLDESSSKTGNIEI